ncbi:MAG: GerW family sporulation protein [Turicibacter sp.]|nr:GerW family sporulation protein [Turicibacter sp.]
MAEQSINNFMKISMENLKHMVDVDTVVGQPIKVDNTTIIPVSKVKFGFAAGGSEFEAVSKNTNDSPFGGGTGGGFTVTPIAFLVVSDKGVEIKHLEERSHLYEKLLEQAPKTIHQILGEFDKDRKNDVEI